MKLIKIKEFFYLLSNETAKHGDYALTCFGKVKMYDKNAAIPTLWSDGCSKILASTNLYAKDLCVLNCDEIEQLLPTHGTNTANLIINFIDNHLKLDWYKNYTLAHKNICIEQYLKSLIKDEWECEAKLNKGIYKIHSIK